MEDILTPTFKREIMRQWPVIAKELFVGDVIASERDVETFAKIGAEHVSERGGDQ